MYVQEELRPYIQPFFRTNFFKQVYKTMTGPIKAGSQKDRRCRKVINNISQAYRLKSCLSCKELNPVTEKGWRRYKHFQFMPDTAAITWNPTDREGKQSSWRLRTQSLCFYEKNVRSRRTSRSSRADVEHGARLQAGPMLPYQSIVVRLHLRPSRKPSTRQGGRVRRVRILRYARSSPNLSAYHPCDISSLSLIRLSLSALQRVWPLAIRRAVLDYAPT